MANLLSAKCVPIWLMNHDNKGSSESHKSRAGGHVGLTMVDVSCSEIKHSQAFGNNAYSLAKTKI